MKNTKQHRRILPWVAFLWALFLPCFPRAQVVTFNYADKSISVLRAPEDYGITLQSAYPGSASNTATVEKMEFVDIEELMKPNADLSVGMEANIDTRDRSSINGIIIRVYVFNSGASNGRGDLLLEMERSESSASVNEDATLVLSGKPPGFEGREWSWLRRFPYSNLKFLSQGARNYFQRSAEDEGGACINYTKNFIKSYFYKRTGNFFGNQPYDCFSYTTKQPVIIELIVKGNATLKKVKLPYIGVKAAMDIWKLKLPGTYHGLNVSVENSSLTFSSQAGTVAINTMALKNTGNTNISFSHATIKAEKLMPQLPQSEGTYDFFNNYPQRSRFIDQLAPGAAITFNDPAILFTGDNFKQGLHAFYLEYSISSGSPMTDVNGNRYTLLQDNLRSQIGIVNTVPANKLSAYDITKTMYDNNIPVYKLKGGMSAEYCVEKALANLDYGISHTWDVRLNSNGQPDLEDGGPVSVYPTPDFLDKSVTKTISLYNTNLGSAVEFNTVILSMGLASIPYFSQAFKAPVLPLQFLAAVNSIGQVREVVRHANSTGYKCYATAGYDPSMIGEGAAWIKLLSLPEKYKQFLKDHKVQNVLIIGAAEKSIGETEARRVLLPEGNGEDYAEGSIYAMAIGGADGLRNMKSYYRDYEDFLMEETKNIADWESGICDKQIATLSRDVTGIANLPVNVRIITGVESVDLWQIAADIMLKYYRKNQTTARFPTIRGVALNEYLVGFPGWETRKAYIPFLWWQERGAATYNANRLLGPVMQKVTEAFPSTDQENFIYYLNNKADRGYLETALINAGVSANKITKNTRNKADVWNTSDGMTSPCELIATDIKDVIRYDVYKSSLTSLQALTFTDLDEMKNASTEGRDKAAAHPAPAIATTVFNASDQSFLVKSEEYNTAGNLTYWQGKQYPHRVLYSSYSGSANAIVLQGWIDGSDGLGEKRKQRVVTAEFDLSNTSDEYSLKVAYKFNPQRSDGFLSYKADDGEEQNMDCFEFVKVPANDWFDIPSRMMEREGATLIVNGSVYDFDYNGIPGVVPFIKKNNVIKAQPQILSFKGEGVFAWNWGATKSVAILPRAKEVGDRATGAGVAVAVKTLFQSATRSYSNALGGMTYMNKSNAQYNITDIQPTWMLNYPKFSDLYLGGASGSGTTVRCFLTYAGTPWQACVPVLEKLSVAGAPKTEGWNDCSKLENDEFVKRFSALAYQQYERTFDQLPNARTFVALKDQKLYVGAVDGDLGAGGAKGYALTKLMGMKNWELNNYFRYKGFSRMINLDGGSSTQMWLNGRGPLHYTGGYPLRDDNQGPFYSRLVSSFLMAVPKLHTEQVGAFNNSCEMLVMNNQNLIFTGTTAVENEKVNKSYISLSTGLPKLIREDNAKGIIACTFKIENNTSTQGAILFAAGEDTYYPDTKGESVVVPSLNNLLVIGVGKIPSPLLETLQLKTVADAAKNAEFSQILTDNNQSVYVIRLQGGFITKYIIGERNYLKFLNNAHTEPEVLFYTPGNNFFTALNGELVINNGKSSDYRTTIRSAYTASDRDYQFLNTGKRSNYCYIGAVNVDGRYVPGNASVRMTNFLIIGNKAINRFTSSDIGSINSYFLAAKTSAPISLATAISNKFYNDDVYFMPFTETSGQHVFAVSNNSQNRLYGLKLNVTGEAGATQMPSGAALRIADNLVSEIPANKGINVYPNPTEGKLHIDFKLENEGNVTFEIVDMLGRPLLQEERTLGAGLQHAQLDISKLKRNSTYILVISGGSKHPLVSEKIILK